MLVRAGYKVANVKHAGHGFDLDTEGKIVGGINRPVRQVVIVSRGAAWLFADVSDHMNVEDVRERYLDASYDLILAEGWRSEDYPKIIVVRDQIGEVPFRRTACWPWFPISRLRRRCHCIDPDDVAGVAALIIRHFPKPRRDDA